MDLTKPEQALWDAFPTGGSVDLTGASDIGVRAEVIAALLLGARRPKPGCLPALRLTGAQVTGQLNLAYADITCPLRLRSCRFAERVDLYGARTRQLNFTGSRLAGLQASLAMISGNLRLAEATCEGGLWLTGAHISGTLHLQRAKVRNPGAVALLGNRLVVDDDLLASEATVEGESRLAGATIGGVLVLSKAKLRNPDGPRAFTASNMSVGAGFVARNLSVHGAMSFGNVRVGDDLDLSGARLSNPGGDAIVSRSLRVGTTLRLEHGFTAEGAVRFPQATARELILRPDAVDGRVDLSQARFEVIHDDPRSWPATMNLEGLSYDALDPQLPAARRLGWLARDRDGDGGYLQLAAAYQRLGDDAGARTILLARQRERWRRRPWYARLWGQIQDVTVGYGYRPLRAAAWLCALLVLGTAVFGLHHPPVLHGDPAPAFNSFIYTLDLLLPVVDLGLKHAYDPQGAQRWLAYALVAAGWLFATTIAAGVTRVLRRE